MRLLLTFLFAAVLSAGDMPIGGISHVGFRVADLEKTRAFYTGVLGFQEAFEQKNAAGKTNLAVFKINDDQFLEFTPGAQEGAPEHFTHIAFFAPKLEELRELIDNLGLKPPDLRTGRDRTRNFSIQDPDRHRIEFIRYEADSLQALARGKFADARRLSTHLHHASIASNEDGANFFRDKLGFIETTPGLFHPALAPQDHLELLPAGSACRLAFDLKPGDEPRELRDPDGTIIELKRFR